MRSSSLTLITGILVTAQLAVAAPAITRGPFLQLGAETEITLVWHTDVPVQGRVRFGTAPSQLDQTVTESEAATVHVSRLTGLLPATRYYYSLEAGAEVLVKGTELSFRTHPPKGNRDPFRFLAFGDSGTGSSAQLELAKRMKELALEPDFGLILGDIIYPAGERENYDPRYFRPYQPLLQRMVIWPTIGNHDVGTDNGDPYLENFYLPTNNPQDSELYYSFDYGNAHFVCLDTHRSSFTAGSAQLQWLEQDLVASSAQWKFVFFHVPPYSGGTHSDSASVKANILPILEAAGVDVVFSGHSHVYERTYLLKNHTILQSHDDTYDQRTSTGTVYVVSGTAGQSGLVSNPFHSLMAFQKGSTYGASVIEVSGPVVRGYFLDSTNKAHDLFTLYKSDDVDPPRLASVRAPTLTRVDLVFDEPVAATSIAPTHFVISPSVEVTDAVLQSDGRTVQLTTAPHAPGTYRVEVSRVRDTATPTENQIPAGTGATYSPPAVFVQQKGTWRYQVGSSAPAGGWNSPAFDDASWSMGRAPIGYGETGIGSSVPSGTISVYARTGFEVPDPSIVNALRLGIRFDDGFVAFLNGVEIARKNVPAGQTNTTQASTTHEATAVEEFALLEGPAHLSAGTNVLAIEIHNANTTSSDLVLDAELVAAEVTPLPPYVVTFSPPDLATEIPLAGAITATVRDDGVGIAEAGITLKLGGEKVTPTISGTPDERVITFAPTGGFAPGVQVHVELKVENQAGVATTPVTWSFRTVGEGEARDGGVESPGTASDGGTPGTELGVGRGCGCTSAPGFAMLALVALVWRVRRKDET